MVTATNGQLMVKGNQWWVPATQPLCGNSQESQPWLCSRVRLLEGHVQALETPRRLSLHLLLGRYHWAQEGRYSPSGEISKVEATEGFCLRYRGEPTKTRCGGSQLQHEKGLPKIFHCLCSKSTLYYESYQVFFCSGHSSAALYTD